MSLTLDYFGCHIWWASAKRGTPGLATDIAFGYSEINEFNIALCIE